MPKFKEIIKLNLFLLNIDVISLQVKGRIEPMAIPVTNLPKTI